MTGNYRKRPTKLSSALSLLTCTHRKSNLPTVATTPSEKDILPLCSLLSFSHKQGGTKEGSRGTPCLNCIKISKETDQPTQLRRTCHSLPSPCGTQDALITRTSHVSFPLRTFPDTGCPGPSDNFMPPLPSPSHAGRKRFCHQIHAIQ